MARQGSLKVLQLIQPWALLPFLLLTEENWYFWTHPAEFTQFLSTNQGCEPDSLPFRFSALAIKALKGFSGLQHILEIWFPIPALPSVLIPDLIKVSLTKMRHQKGAACAAPEVRLLLGWPFHYCAVWVTACPSPSRQVQAAEDGKCGIISVQDAEKVRIIHCMCRELSHRHNLSFLPSKEVVLFPPSPLCPEQPTVLLFLKMLKAFTGFHRPAGQEQQDSGGNIRNLPAFSSLKKSFQMSLPRLGFFTPFP